MQIYDITQDIILIIVRCGIIIIYFISHDDITATMATSTRSYY